MSMLFLPAVIATLLPMAEAGEESGLLGAIGVGLTALGLLLGLIFVVVSFGKGRDHS